MEQKDWASVVAVMRSAPLQNMDHAEQVGLLIAKVVNFAKEQQDDSDEPTNGI